MPPLRQTLRQIYGAEVGVREATNRNDGARVEQYLRYVGQKKGLSYCAAFVCWAFGKAGIANPKNGWSPALFPEKKVVWRPYILKTVMPSAAEASHKQGIVEPGDVFGIYFIEIKRIAHCGFVETWDGTWITSVEANTTDIRAGPQGVFRKRRLVRSLYKVVDWIR